MGFTVPGFKSLVHSEHSYRQACRERGILDLGMMRIDVRCAALESISTQSTLIAGFAFSSLAPDVLDTLKREADDNLVDILFAVFHRIGPHDCCTPISGCSRCQRREFLFWGIPNLELL